MKTRRYWLPAFFWAAVIFAFSSIEVTPASEIYWQDFIVKKTAHVVEYAILFTLLYRAFTNTSGFSKKQAALVSFFIVVVYGISDEYHQSFTPGREPKPRDVGFDAAGGLLAYLAIWKYLPRAPEKLKKLARDLQIS